jgi:hypothetical protein
MLGVCYLALQEVQTWIFYILPNSQGSMTSQGMFEMHMFLLIKKKLSMHKIVQSHLKLNLGLLFLYR